jgi:hypothetical protein
MGRRFTLHPNAIGLEFQRTGAKPDRGRDGRIEIESDALARDIRTCEAYRLGLIVESAFHAHPNLPDNLCGMCGFSAMPWTTTCPRCGTALRAPFAKETR